MNLSNNITQKNILILENSKMLNNYLSAEFSKDGHNLTQAFSIAETIQTLSTHSFDLILLSLHLPDGDGKEIVKLIKKKYKNTRIIILSSDNKEEEREQLFSYGILDYFVKDNKIKYSIEEIKKELKQLDYNQNFNILIVDNSINERINLRTLLVPQNYTILEAGYAKDALKIYKNKKIDLIILDTELSDIHGLEVLKSIKVDEKSEMPVIVLSSQEDHEVIRKTYKFGAAEYIHKPYLAEEILIKIHNWLENYVAGIELKKRTQLMQEYHDTIEISNIVSKTDINGIITYVNQSFCEISGYSKEEVIGKAHSCIRHPDMKASLFKDLWKTIKSKKTWQGIIKNQKKDGTHYWVDTIVRPIIDTDGEISEYIAIRKDITEIQDLKERLKNDLNVTTNNFQEAYQRSLEYEHAIAESNILSRTDTNGKITYINEEYKKISAYTEDEILHKNYNFCHSPDLSSKLTNDISTALKNGDTWKGIIKNKTKNNQNYWLSSVIIPLKDVQGNVLEYMFVQNDISEIISLHAEVENTQKELIYRMGEIAESRSRETGNHIKRVAAYSKILALKYGLSADDAELLFIASPMHDIGKLGTPDAVLNKEGPLDKDEWEIMKTHSQVGHDILFSSDKPILQASAIVAHQHHEKWNGQGYPQGLAGEDIHIYGRITAIADVFDALGSERCYKEAWPDERIIKLFQDERGVQFDPKLVDIFFEHIEEFYEIREKYKDII